MHEWSLICRRFQVKEYLFYEFVDQTEIFCINITMPEDISNDNNILTQGKREKEISQYNISRERKGANIRRAFPSSKSIYSITSNKAPIQAKQVLWLSELINFPFHFPCCHNVYLMQFLVLKTWNQSAKMMFDLEYVIDKLLISI